MPDGPMDENTLEGLGLGQSDGTMLSRVLKRQERASQKWRVREVGMVIGEGTKFDHGRMLPRAARLRHGGGACS